MANLTYAYGILTIKTVTVWLEMGVRGKIFKFALFYFSCCDIWRNTNPKGCLSGANKNWFKKWTCIEGKLQWINRLGVSLSCICEFYFLSLSFPFYSKSIFYGRIGEFFWDTGKICFIMFVLNCWDLHFLWWIAQDLFNFFSVLFPM